MRRAVLGCSFLVLTALAARPLPAETAATRKSGTKTSASVGKATPRPAAPGAEEKAANTPAKSATKPSAGSGAARSAPSESEPTPRPKKSPVASEAATPKPRKREASDANDTGKKANPQAEKASAPESAIPAKDVESAATETPARKDGHGPNATIEPSALAEFATQPPRVQAVIEAALALTKRQLTYTYGSADPESGGMDCSGTIYYLLRAHGFPDVPRDSAGQYTWLRKAGTFRAVISKSATSFEFDELLPGDLMFWSGTYNVEREIPVTHVMLYLGTEKKTKKRVMFGASDGRTYDGLQRWGVSVFDFKMPRNDAAGGSKTDFLGYGRIPGLRTTAAPAEVARNDSPAATEAGEKHAVAATEPVAEADAAAAVPKTKSSKTKKAAPETAGSSTRKRKS